MSPQRPSPATLSLAGLEAPDAVAEQDRMLRALQDALRRAIAAGPEAANQVEFWADLDRAYQAYDRWIAHVSARNPISCARGCTACCHDNPHGVAGVEILRIQRALSSSGLEAELREDITEAAAAFAALSAEHGPEAALQRQRSQGRPCPLLGADGDCRAYPQRPVACRMFHALSPAAWCHPAHPEHARRQNPNLLPPLVCRQILGAISRCLGLPASGNLWEGLAARPAG